MKKKLVIAGIVSLLCIVFFSETLICKMLGEIDKYKAGKNVISMSEFKEVNQYEKNV